jgi:hypothetical protein
MSKRMRDCVVPAGAERRLSRGPCVMPVGRPYSGLGTRGKTPPTRSFAKNAMKRHALGPKAALRFCIRIGVGTLCSH